jgi:long-chain acyl-CoA synthetase
MERMLKGSDPRHTKGVWSMQTIETRYEVAPVDTSALGVAMAPALVTDAITGNARWHAHKTAVICGSRRLTWSEFNARVTRVANGLLGLGVRKGDKIAVLMPNSIEAAETMCGIVKAGGVVVPLSTLLTGSGLLRQIADSDAKVLFVGAPFDQKLGSERAMLDGVVKDGFVACGFQAEGWRLYEEVLAEASEAEPLVALTYGDDFNIMYSSGTTGVPKGIVHTHFARQQFCLGLAMACRMNLGTVGILTTPMYSNGT